jgi:hypothetical protein
MGLIDFPASKEYFKNESETDKNLLLLQCALLSKWKIIMDVMPNDKFGIF